ncbi:MAG TPA: protein kinase [Myxococcota bacterium]|jgi:tetratricopeptide (TPR) repeat protein|nr:protein kinase [Myxococcota bacterium]
MTITGEGALVGPWRLVQRLGAGGMGEIWRAEGPDGAVAVKLLPAHLDDDHLRRRFAREGRALLALHHPNVVRALALGETAEGRPYLAMELLRGESLAERLRARGVLRATDAAGVVLQAAAGLAAAHRAGLVHRDVKPANLFLREDGVVKVLDFGVALRTATAPGDEAERLTLTGLVGTPSYMAPEQASGGRDEDERTDVWGLGAVLHRALAGHPPFRAGRQPYAELYRVINDPPDALPPWVSAALAAIVQRALQKDPAERFASMEAMREALATAHAEVQAEAQARDAGEVTAPGDALYAGAGAGADAPEHGSPPPPSVLDEEVRLVVALLAEEVNGTVGLAGFLREVRRHGGRASALQQRRAVAVFGGAEWAGDEVDRALAAALAARPFAARLGVGTGRAVVHASGDGHALLGEAFSAAAEALSAAASAASTAVSSPGGRGAPAPSAPTVGACPTTARHAQGAFRLDGPCVIGALPGPRGPAVREVGGVEVPFVGRDAEVRRLLALVERAGEASRAQVAVVVGAPGIGKSRLRLEVRRRCAALARPVVQLEARGEVARMLAPHAAMQGLLRRHAELPEGTAADEARARVQALVAGAGLPPPQQADTVAFVGELLGVPFPETAHLRTARAEPAVMRDRIRLALGDLFEALAGQATVLLVVEDLQWVDAASLEVVDFLLQRLGERSLAVLATARPELAAERPDVLPGAERLELRELGPRDVGAIVERILGRGEPAVVERAAGNPYFAEELSLAVREGAAPESLPPTVEGAVQARFDKLHEGERDLLKRAAVIGRRFWTESLVALGAADAAQLLPALRRRDLAVPRPESRLAGCREWAFRHAVVQEVVLRSLTDAQRRALHLQAAAWLAALPDAAPEELARHYVEAASPARARPYWLAAAAAAERRGDSREVVAFTDRVLDAPGVAAEGAASSPGAAALPPAEEMRLRVRRLQALAWLGRHDDEQREVAALDVVERRAGEAAAPALRVEAWRQRAHLRRRKGERDGALEAADRAVEAGEAVADGTLLARAFLTRVEMLSYLGRFDEAGAAAAQAVAAAGRVRPADQLAARAAAATAKAIAAGYSGHAATALAAVREAREAHEEAGDLRQVANMAVNEGAMLATLGDATAADRMQGYVLGMTRSLGLKRIEAFALHNRGLARARLGDFAGGVALEDEAIALARQIGSPRVLAASLAYRSAIHREAGDVAAALADAEAAVAAGGAAGPMVELSCRAALAAALAAAGHAAPALEEADRALARRDAAGGMEEFEVDLLLARHDALSALGRAGEARAALVAARAAFDHHLAEIPDAHFRRTFSERVPAHARLLALTGPAAPAPG